MGAEKDYDWGVTPEALKDAIQPMTASVEVSLYPVDLRLVRLITEAIEP